MTDLELSVMAHSLTMEQDLQPSLAKFEAQYQPKYKVHMFLWGIGLQT